MTRILVTLELDSEHNPPLAWIIRHQVLEPGQSALDAAPVVAAPISNPDDKVKD